jgi:dihydrolipoamide dehydrogenase
MTERLKTQVLVVGAGPGGYVAAIRAGRLALDTTLIEAGRLGGTCLIRGCIPSKAMIHAADTLATVNRARDKGPLGIHIDGTVRLDFAQTQQWKDGIVERLSDGVASLLKQAKVRVELGWGTFSDAKTCRVERPDGSSLTIEAEHVILATGSDALALPRLPWSNDVLSSTEALSLASVPDRLAIVGAGYIGLELGMAFRKFGSEVTIVEAQDAILPQYDPALTAPVAKAIVRAGITVHLKTRAKAFGADGLKVEGDGDKALIIPADKVLVTVGRRARLDGYGLEAIGVDLESGFVRVDDQCRTSMKGVWAIGDLVGEPMLAHKASAQGEMVAEIIAGHRRRFAPVTIPAVCFTDPEVVTVGKVAEGGANTVTAVFPLAANGRSLSMEAADDGGFVRVVARADDHRILELAAVGRGVSELSGEMVTLIEMGAVLEDVVGIIHAHPTQSEMVREAVLRSLGQAIHI